MGQRSRVSARVVRWLSMPHETVPENKDDRAAWSTLVDIPVSEPPRFAIEVAGLTGGRRLLSGDRQALDAIALLVGRRVDAIRLARERYERQIREQEIGRLATEAELRALRAQINPHFLFNALTAIGYLIQTAPARALETLMRLTSLLRGILRSDGDLTTLGQELDVIESYLDIERARFEDRLAVTIDVPASLRSLPLPPLVLQPIVENAIKHGISPMRQGGGVTIAAWIDAIETPTLSIAITDTGAGATAGALDRGRREGVGLRNVERRLECRYGASAAVSVTSHPGAGTSVRIRIPVDRSCLDVAGIAQPE